MPPFHPTAARPSAAAAWAGVLSAAAPVARGVAALCAIGTLGVNLAAGPSSAGAMHLLTLALVLIPVGRAVGTPGVEAATPALASLALYWAMLAGLTLADLEHRPWLVLARFEGATLALGLVWRLAAAILERVPAHPLLPAPTACGQAGDAALGGAAILSLGALAFTARALAGFGNLNHELELGAAALAVALIALARLRSADALGHAVTQPLASLSVLAHSAALPLMVAMREPHARALLTDPTCPLAAALLLALSVLWSRLARSRASSWLGFPVPDVLGRAALLASRVAALGPLAHAARLDLHGSAHLLASALILAVGSGRRADAPPDTTSGWLARAAWPALLVLASSHLLAVLVARTTGTGDLVDHLVITPSLALVLVGWRVAFRRASAGPVPAWLAARLEPAALDAQAVLTDRALFPLALIPLAGALQAGALTAVRLALSVVIQALVFRERKSDGRRIALAVTLGLTSVHMPLALLGQHGALGREALPAIAVSVLAGALLLELARALLERLDEPELAALVSQVALTSAGLALPCVGASVLFEHDPASTPLARIGWNAASLALTAVYYVGQGARRKSELLVYIGEIAGAALYGYLRVTGVVHRTEWTGLVAVAMNFGIYALARWAARLELAAFARPLRTSSYLVPLMVCAFELRYIDVHHPWGAIQMLLAMGAFYTTAVLDGSWRNLQYVAALCYNAALFLAWSTVNPQGLQGYFTCVGVTLLWIVHANRDAFSAGVQSSLRTLATLLLVIGPVGEWVQRTGDPTRLLELAGTAAIVGTLGVLMRVRVLLYAGTLTFVLSLGGSAYHLSRVSVGLRTLVLFSAGGGVIALAALFEKQRDKILGRIKQIQSELASWV